MTDSPGSFHSVKNLYVANTLILDDCFGGFEKIQTYISKGTKSISLMDTLFS